MTSGFQTEIILLIILAASIILIFSNLGMGGTVGATISAAFFGVMGILAYLFPILIFGCAVFLVSNRRNPLAYKKALAALLFCIFLCGLIQLLRSEDIPLDYVELAGDLYEFQTPDGAARVRLRWGQDFYRNAFRIEQGKDDDHA